MDMQKFNIMIPYQIGDIIQAEGYVNKYTILDIQTIYSAKERNVKDIIFLLHDIDTNTDISFHYNDHKWKMVEAND